MSINSHQVQGSRVFWGELSPSEHIAQFYETDKELLDSLTAFIGEGLLAGESTIVIATPEHLRSLQKGLKAAGIDLDKAILQDRYITADAETALASFVVGAWPDERFFGEMVSGLLDRAAAGGRRVRAFGEMVALLWSRGDIAATVRLEHLWNNICEQAPLSLFCAYPRVGTTMNPSRSMVEICAAHSRIIPGDVIRSAPAAAAD